MLKLLRNAGITGFKTNTKIHGYEVDFLWRDLGFAVEVDGYDGHSGRHAFERDRLKWARLQAKGIQVMPVTGRQFARTRRASRRASEKPWRCADPAARPKPSAADLPEHVGQIVTSKAGAPA
jgi:very-short-patch-repair endonuclease